METNELFENEEVATIAEEAIAKSFEGASVAFGMLVGAAAVASTMIIGRYVVKPAAAKVKTWYQKKKEAKLESYIDTSEKKESSKEDDKKE